MGGTFNEYSIQEGNHILGMARFYLREGHSHGNFMSIFNILIGLTLENLMISERLKKICSYSAMAAIMLPVGLFLTGVMGGDPANVPPIGMIGILGVAASLIIMIIGA